MAQAPDTQPPEHEAAAARLSRRSKILLLVILLFPLILLLSIYLALRSPLLERWIWPRLQPVIAEQTGFQVELQRLRLDPLGQLEIGGLQVRQAHPDCEAFELTLDSLELRFSALKLFKKNILIDLLAVRNLNAHGCLVIDRTATATTETAAPTAKTDPLASILALLDNPSHGVLVRKLLLENLQLDLQVRDTQNRLHLAWQGQLDMETSFYWLERQIQGELQTRLVSHQPLQLTDDGLQLRVQPQFSTALDWQVQPQAGQWQAQLTLQDLQIGLTDLWLQQGDAARSQLTFALPAWQLQMDGEFSSLLPRQQRPETSWPLQLDWVINSQQPQAATLHWSDAINQQSARLQLGHSLQLGSNGQIDLNQPVLDQLEADAQLTLQLEQLELQQATSQIRLAQGQLTLDATILQQARLALNLALQQLQGDFSLQPLDLALQTRLDVDRTLEQASLDTSLALNQQRLLAFSNQLSNRPLQLQLDQQLQLNITRQLADLFAAAAPLRDYGDLAIQLQGQQRLDHNRSNLLVAGEEPLQGTLHSNQQLTLTLEPASPRQPIQLHGPLQALLDVTLPFPDLQPRFHLLLQQAGLQLPQLREPLPFELLLEGELRPNLDWLTGRLKLDVDRQPLLELYTRLDNPPRQAELRLDTDLHARADLARWIAEAEPLQALGNFRLQSTLNLQLQHPADSLQTLGTPDPAELQASATLGGWVSQQPATAAPVQLQQALRFDHALHWQPQGAELKANYRIPALQLPELLQAEALALQLNASLNSGLSPTNLDLQFQASGEQAQWLQPDASLDTRPIELAPVLFPLQLALNATLNQENNQLHLQQAQLKLAQWLQSNLQGWLQLDGQQAELAGELQLQPQPELLPDERLQGSGSLRLPWQLNLAEGRLISLQARAAFDDLSLRLDDLQLQGLQGQINLDQELELRPGNRIAFRYLLVPEPFQRADFNRMEPFLGNQQAFSLQQLRLGNLQVGPLQATLPIRQNLIRLQEFSLQLFDGDLAGQFYLDITPGAWKLGLLSRVSRVDLRRISPAVRSSGRHAPVSARTAIEFDLNRRLLEGRIDITDMNRPQLLQLLDLVDPDHLDPQINTVRSALRLAHPQWVTVQMQQGLMDLRLGLSLFSEPLLVRGLPLSPIIERFGETALALPASLPLE